MSLDDAGGADFPGLQDSEGKESYSDDSDEERDFLKVKKPKDKHKKDKGYKAFAPDVSDEEEDKSPAKTKKSKGIFRRGLGNKTKEKEREKDSRAKKREKEESKAEKKEKERFSKSDRRERDIKLERKEREKESKAEKKDKQRKKSSQQYVDATEEVSVVKPPKAVFGVPLSVSVDRSKLYDGVELPAVVRDCVDFVENNALTTEGIYRLSGVKSQIAQLRQCYDKGQSVNLEDYDPHVVAGLLKQYLREIPEPVLTLPLMPKFDEVAALQDEALKLEGFKQLLGQLPVYNRTLLSWIIVHMTHIIEEDNKMSLQNVSIVISPTMRISHRILNVLLSHSTVLFKDVNLKRPVKPLRWQASHTSLELPSDSALTLEEEMSRQEAILASYETEEKLWEVQRIVTTLKRKIRQSKKQQEAKLTKVKIEEVDEKGKQEEIVKEEVASNEETPEKEVKKQDVEVPGSEPENKTEIEPEQEEESIEYLIETECQLLAEQEEMISLGDELRKLIINERNEVERLKNEILEIKDERGHSSNSSYSSTSSEESSDSEDDNEEELQRILQDLLQENQDLDCKNNELCVAIHEEQEACMRLRVK
ncbi:ralA-binding protein 1-like [Saccoglossus kowalevskii]|uniref:RalA-binding protein 1-like n=1 Tax=Saccoglossus kowalevskii TaxID=10224 RepID=A0ABM0MI37_SACKO|nr:PREDICTED: ralA-binding protein 1-like [Saccoglossus kowalevskii]